MTTTLGPTGRVNFKQTAATAVTGAAALAGAWFSYDFGVQLGGVLMGVVAAANGAAMGLLLTSAVLDAVLPSRRG